MSMPNLAWRATMSFTARGSRPWNVARSLLASASFTFCGRGRLPACETRIRSTLCFTRPSLDAASRDDHRTFFCDAQRHISQRLDFLLREAFGNLFEHERTIDPPQDGQVGH